MIGFGAAAAGLIAVSSEPNLRRRTGLASLAHDLQRAVLRRPYSV